MIVLTLFYWYASHLYALYSSVFSILRNLKTARMTFEPAWVELSRAKVVGMSSLQHKRTGITRISSLRDFPGLRPVFHTLFSQDPMHDFCEGVLLWFCHRAMDEYCTTDLDRERTAEALATARTKISASLQWPLLSATELEFGTHWHLSGMYHFGYI